jgi:hypothetical protein
MSDIFNKAFEAYFINNNSQFNRKIDLNKLRDQVRGQPAEKILDAYVQYRPTDSLIDTEAEFRLFLLTWASFNSSPGSTNHLIDNITETQISGASDKTKAEFGLRELFFNNDDPTNITVYEDFVSSIAPGTVSQAEVVQTPPPSAQSNEVAIPQTLVSGITGDNLTRLQEAVNLLLVGQNKVFTTTEELNRKLTEIANGSSEEDKNRMIYALRTLSSLLLSGEGSPIMAALKNQSNNSPIPLQTRWLIGDLLQHSLFKLLAQPDKINELKQNQFYKKFFEGVGNLPPVEGLGDKFTTQFIPYLSPQAEESFNGGIIGLDRVDQFSQGKNFGDLTTATATLMGANTADNPAKAEAWINIYRDLIPRKHSSQYTTQAPNTSGGLTVPQQAFYAFALKMLTDINLPTNAVISKIEVSGEKYKLTYKENGTGGDKTIEVSLKNPAPAWDNDQRNVTKAIMSKIIEDTTGKTFLVDKSRTGYSDGATASTTTSTTSTSTTPSTGATTTTGIVVDTGTIEAANPITYTLPNQAVLTQENIQDLMTNWLKAKETVYNLAKPVDERNNLLTRFTTGQYLEERQRGITQTRTFENQQIISIDDVQQVNDTTYTAVITTKEDQDGQTGSPKSYKFTFTKTEGRWKISDSEPA